MLAGGWTVTTGNGKTAVSDVTGEQKTKMERRNTPQMILSHILI
jgi:hypothetical protein